MTTSDALSPNPRRARRHALRGFTLLAFSCAAFAGLPSASAQSQDEAAARSLFNEGRQLVKAGRYEQACSKFEAARKLFVSPGLLLNLADCHEHVNRTASAWTEFGDAADAAGRAGRTKDETEARKRQAALEDRLSRLTIHPESPAPDEIVKRDGAPLDRAAWDTAIPVDPGTHVVAAEAAERRPWSKSIEVTEPGQTVTVSVPRLENTAAAQAEANGGPASNSLASSSGSAASSTTPPGESQGPSNPAATGNTQRVVGWVVGGTGVAAMAASGVLGLFASSLYSTAKSESGPSRHTDSVNAGQLADVGTVVLIAGGVVTAAGIVVWLTAPRAPVAVGTSGQALFVAGRF